jgi:hypothetical protein
LDARSHLRSHQRNHACAELVWLGLSPTSTSPPRTRASDPTIPIPMAGRPPCPRSGRSRPGSRNPHPCASVRVSVPCPIAVYPHHPRPRGSRSWLAPHRRRQCGRNHHGIWRPRRARISKIQLHRSRWLGLYVDNPCGHHTGSGQSNQFCLSHISSKFSKWLKVVLC